MKRTPAGLSAWHVFTRGPRRLVLFHDDQDYRRFLSILGYALRASGAILWAYTLMSNHYHFVIQATSEQLTACMIRLNRMYSRYYNDRYRQLGHAYDGPYKAYRQKGLFFILKRIAYVFLNPVAAGLVSRPEDYQWSSYRNMLGITGSALDVDPTPVFRMISDQPYLALQRFQGALAKEASRPKRTPPSHVPALEVQADEFEWLLEHARSGGMDLGGENPTDVAIHWAKLCGIPPRAIACALGETSTGRIRTVLWRFESKVKERPEIARRLPLP